MLSSKPSPTRRRGGTPSSRLLSLRVRLPGVQVDPFEGTTVATGDRPPSSPSPDTTGPVAEAATSGKPVSPARTVGLTDHDGRLGDPHGLTDLSVVAEGAVDSDGPGGIPLVNGLVGGVYPGILTVGHWWTQDQWVLSTVTQGLTLAFTTEPPSGPHFRETPVPEDPALSTRGSFPQAGPGTGVTRPHFQTSGDQVRGPLRPQILSGVLYDPQERGGNGAPF